MLRCLGSMRIGPTSCTVAGICRLTSVKGLLFTFAQRLVRLEALVPMQGVSEV